MWRAVLLWRVLAAPAAAQGEQWPILVIDQERLFAESAAGERVRAELERRSADLAAENRRIEAELIAEERDLTERRADLEPDEFRKLANAFDRKVQSLRARQDEKVREVGQLREAERQAFARTLAPVLSDLAGERGALVVLDRRTVLISADAIDVTDELIRRLDAAAPADGVPGRAPAATVAPDPGAAAPEAPDLGAGAATEAPAAAE
jgi:Skp family chaperone for outer membrane proteins